ncbi:MAG: hypothetical protein OXE99_11735 [Cellvibrionales bacterium]|nr:hypothetical protein [Cellvibrionales bacterium]
MQWLTARLFFALFIVCFLPITLTSCSVIAPSAPKTYRHASNFEETQLQSTLQTDDPVMPDIYIFAQMLAERHAVLAGKENSSDPTEEERNTHHKLPLSE